MSEDEVLALAKQAGFPPSRALNWSNELIEFARLIREDCAQVVERGGYDKTSDLATAIRSGTGEGR